MQQFSIRPLEDSERFSRDKGYWVLALNPRDDRKVLIADNNSAFAWVKLEDFELSFFAVPTHVAERDTHDH